ncbi:MAG: TMEM175 family protein, partial [Planctomycetota bacterium]
MKRGRLEAFSDGVLAIVITIMVLELKAPHDGDWAALAPLLPRFVAYVLSFVYIGIYWNNHHHLLHGVERVTGGILWANLHLLFWLSLVPFATAWMGESHFADQPTGLYGVVLLMAAIAFTILQTAIVRAHGRDAVVARAVGRDRKGQVSLACYVAAIPVAFVAAW